MKWLKQRWKDSGFRMLTYVFLFGTMVWDMLTMVFSAHHFYYTTTVLGWGMYFLLILPIHYLTRKGP